MAESEAQTKPNGTDIETEPQAEDEQVEEDPWETWGRGDQMFVTVRKGGTIAPNQTVYENYLADSEAVLIRRRKDVDIIGLAPIDEYDESDNTHYKVGSESSNGSVHARGFLKAQGLAHDESRRYTPEWDSEHGLLVIDLTEEGELASPSTDDENDDD